MTAGSSGGERPLSARDTLFADERDRAPDGRSVPAADPRRDDPGGIAAVPPFRFDEAVARVFPDMLARSIPGYASIVAQTGLLAARFARPDTRLYDLGCSLGASALSMRAALAVPNEAADERGPNREREIAGETDSGERSATERRSIARSCTVHGVDDSAAMLARARELVAEAERAGAATTLAPPVHLHQADLVTCPLERASVVAMNFTLQFVVAEARAALMERIARALVPGGALILSEKLRFEDPRLEALHVDMYHAFKRANGYSALEIARKRVALEDVLVPDTLAEHERRLARAGFARTSVWFQCFNFVSLVAIRD